MTAEKKKTRKEIISKMETNKDIYVKEKKNFNEKT